jgi:hypothetical protein
MTSLRVTQSVHTGVKVSYSPVSKEARAVIYLVQVGHVNYRYFLGTQYSEVTCQRSRI